MGTNNFRLIILIFSLLLSKTTKGSKLNETCFDNCMKLLGETLKVSTYTIAIYTPPFMFIANVYMARHHSCYNFRVTSN